MSHALSPPFDAVLVVAFGGPQGPDDVRPFLENVLRGRRVAPARIDEVAHHYELFGGISPITAFTRQQADGLQERLAAVGTPLPVFVGMRNWHPFLADTLASMSRDGVRRAIVLLAAAYRSYSSCTQYRENVEQARASLSAQGLAGVSVTYAGDWHTHPGFVESSAAHIFEALADLPEDLRAHARLIFTAHSIPASMARQYPYERQLRETAALIAERVRIDTWALVYQSRSGRPEDPWLEPDVGDYLRGESRAGLRAAVLCPVGFICDHIEVLYDLDVEAAKICRSIGLPMVRARAVNDHPRFIDTLADAVIGVVERYRGGRPLPLIAPV